jgi:hypothetical protein
MTVNLGFLDPDEHSHDIRTVTTTKTNSIFAQNVTEIGYPRGFLKDGLRIRHTTTKNGHYINNMYIIRIYRGAKKYIRTST